MIYAAEQMPESFEEWNESLYVILYDLTRGTHPVTPENFLKSLQDFGCTYKTENIVCFFLDSMVQRILSVKSQQISSSKISVSKICRLPVLAFMYTFTMILGTKKDKMHLYLTLSRLSIPSAVPNLPVFPNVFWTLLQGAKHSCTCPKNFCLF